MIRSACISFSIFLGTVSAAPADDPVRVLIIDGRNNHDWISTTDSLRATLEASGRFEVKVSTAPELKFPNVPRKAASPEDEADLAEARAHFAEGEKAAKADLATRWAAWSPDFCSDELYHNMRGPAKNLTLLSRAFSDPGQRGTGLHEPMTWEVSYGKGRVIVTSMGHIWADGVERGEDAAVQCVGFQTIFTRACEFAATGKVTLAKPTGFPDADKPNPVAPHRIALTAESKTAETPALLSAQVKKKTDPHSCARNAPPLFRI